MERKRVIATASACALAAAMAAGGAFAYLTDHKESKENIFTVGKVEVSLNNADFGDGVQTMVCNESRDLQPSVKNTGNVPAIIYLKVSLPSGDYTPVLSDGTAQTSSRVSGGELVRFQSKSSGAAALSDTENTVDSDWLLLSHEGNSYLFGYAQPLAADAATDALFDSITLKNFVQESSIYESTEKLRFHIECEAIQNAYVNDLTFTGTESDKEKTLTDIHNIYLRQTGKTT